MLPQPNAFPRPLGLPRPVGRFMPGIWMPKSSLRCEMSQERGGGAGSQGRSQIAHHPTSTTPC